MKEKTLILERVCMCVGVMMCIEGDEIVEIEIIRMGVVRHCGLIYYQAHLINAFFFFFKLI